MTLTLCGVLGSPFYRKIMCQLTEKGIPFETENLNPFQAGDDFTKQNPIRRIPLLKDTDAGDDFLLPDSSAIFHYIERKYPNSALTPEDTSEYGRALWFEEYADTEMAGTIGLGVFRKMIFPQMSGKEPDMDSALDVVRGKLTKIHDYIETSLDGKTWLAGDALSVADISVAVQYGNLAFTGYAPSASRWPNLAAFMKRIGSRPSFADPHIKAMTLFASMKQLEIDPSENL